MSSMAPLRRDDGDFENLPPGRLAWPGATQEQLEFMRRVYDAHVARASRSGKFVGDIPAGELASVEANQRPRMRIAAAADCRAMFAAARQDLAAEQAAGSARAKGVQWIGITSGYRSASEQFALWQKYFPRYYAATASQRASAAGGPHGPAAVTLARNYVGKWIAAPGYSLHNDGRAADLKTSERGRALGPNGSQRLPWRQTWLWEWLVKRAAEFSFFQNKNIDEPWHWEHRPERLAREAESAPAIAAGQKPIERVPLLAKHHGYGPDLVLRWNDLTRTDEIDVAIHFHGFASEGARMHLVDDKLPVSGLDWRDPDRQRPGQRTRPTLFILPRGQHQGSGRVYGFPALEESKTALRELCTWSLARFATFLGLPRPPRVARLILTAHSGAGHVLEKLMATCDPHEVHVYDATYWMMPSLTKWAVRSIAADPPGAPEASRHALRLFHLRGTKTAKSAEAIRKALQDAICRRPNAIELAKRFRVEAAHGRHDPMPARYGWQLFVNHAADVT